MPPSASVDVSCLPEPFAYHTNVYRPQSQSPPTLPPKPQALTSPHPSGSSPNHSMHSAPAILYDTRPVQHSRLTRPINSPSPSHGGESSQLSGEGKDMEFVLEDRDLELALEMSRQEALEAERQRIAQDEELARVMEESRLRLPPHHRKHAHSTSQIEQTHPSHTFKRSSFIARPTDPEKSPYGSRERTYSSSSDPRYSFSQRPGHGFPSMSSTPPHSSTTNVPSSSYVSLPATIESSYLRPVTPPSLRKAPSEGSIPHRSASSSPHLQCVTPKSGSRRESEPSELLPVGLSPLRSNSSRRSRSPRNLDTLGEEHDELEDAVSAGRFHAAGLRANHFVEPELLRGVSIGFNAPSISALQSTKAGDIPPVIELHYGKYPALHLQAPSWRQMLKMMARMSGTRIQGSISAIAVARHKLQLRTVVQFVKVHHASSEWRTIIYLTTDFPVPTTAADRLKRLTTNDVAQLPYSYTLSPLPALLRDGPESLMSKYYVIPATHSTPYPTLPITFPEMALYLQSAVEDSRRVTHEHISGTWKLVTWIRTCYPSDFEGEEDPALLSRAGVAKMFKKVIKGGKVTRERGLGENEDLCELVTPFVPDEWA